jgi:transcriptional regulator with XRE-family HTH domain
VLTLQLRTPPGVAMAKPHKHIYQQSTWGPALLRLMAASRDCKTQSALAKKSGVGQSTIGRILRGKTDPETGTMTFLAEAFGMPFNALAALANGERSVEWSEVDQLKIDRAEQELESLRRQMNNSIDRLHDLVQAQRCRRSE